jgi:hypothetical protein
LSRVNDIRERINQYIKQEVIKTEAIKKLKIEFGESAKSLNDLWMLVKEENQGGVKINKTTDEPKVEKKTMQDKKKVNFDIQPVRREFKCKIGTFTRTEEGVTFEGLTFKSKADIKMYRDIIDAADLIMDMEV